MPEHPVYVFEKPTPVYNAGLGRWSRMAPQTHRLNEGNRDAQTHSRFRQQFAMNSLFAICLMLLPLKAQKIDHDRLIRVLCSVEGGKNSDMGGAMHLSYSAWTQHTRHPYQLSKTPAYARNIASIHLAWLTRELRESGTEPTIHNLGVCWRRGLTRARELHFSDDYGSRVANLYADPSFK